jgi:ABC-2 type transport system ATP-binding protein
MRVREFLNYMRGFYPKWDDAYAAELQNTFELDARSKLRTLSKGQRARLSLVAALAHRPDLLVLDEPSSGLDPIVRRDILSAIIRTIADQGRTVLFSSHLLDEVERVSDHVAMLHHGRVLFSAGLDDIKETHHRLTLRFDNELTSAPKLDGTLSCEGRGREWTAVCNGKLGDLQVAANRLGARIVDQRVPSLDEIFVAQAGTHRSTF